MNNHLPQDINKRPYHYWFIDGLGEMTAAVLLFLIGAAFYMQGTTIPGSLPFMLSGITGLLLIGGGPWLARPVVVKLKERFTYPRTGYVAYKQPSPRRRAWVLILAFLVSLATVSLLLTNAEFSLAWLPLIEGVAIGGLLLNSAFQHNIQRFYPLAGISIAAGAGLAISGYGDLAGTGIFFLIIGAVVLFSGVCTFRSYRKSYPALEEIGE